jgi:hypothetical protein
MELNVRPRETMPDYDEARNLNELKLLMLSHAAVLLDHQTGVTTP